jgi:hypothetical protein
MLMLLYINHYKNNLFNLYLQVKIYIFTIIFEYPCLNQLIDHCEPAFGYQNHSSVQKAL